MGVAGWAPVGLMLWMALVRPVEGASGVCDTSVLRSTTHGFYRGRRLRRLHLDSPEVRKRNSKPVVDISLISAGARISIRSFSVMER